MNNPPTIQRSDFLDRIRVMLTVLVVLHHTAIMFGGDGGWYLRHAASSQLATILLTLLCAVDQSFFMGAFFLLAGYFTPRSFDGKGLLRFGIDRLLRLGLPILVYGLLIGPLTLSLTTSHDSGAGVLAEWGRLIIRPTFNIGPLWFAWALLIFASIYALVRQIIPHTRVPEFKSVRHSGILIAVIIWATGAFLLRLWVPTGEERWLLQIGFFSSYMLLFAIGCAAAPQRLLERIDGKIAAPWGWLSLLTIPTLFIYAFVSGAFAGAPFKLSGGWTLPAAAYAVWEPLVGCGIILMLLWRCRVATKPWAIWNRLTPLAYCAFIVHPPVVVSAGLLASQWQAPSLLKFAVFGAISVVGSFVVAALIVRLPGARKVL